MDGFTEGQKNPKSRKTEGSKSKGLTETLHTAVIAWWQLHALERDVAAQEVLVCLDKASTVKASPKKKTQSKKGTSNTTAKAILDKDALGHKMTDWEYLI